ncbi:MAG: hypothetical protein GEV05_25620, partial [Betaproteobacteria bacterium]|nr:hypothetical protein [Betaproteobacteria bacterium]
MDTAPGPLGAIEALPPGPLGAIEGLPVAQAMRQWLWLYPGVEIVHILGFVLLVGSIVMFDLRLLGLSKAIPVPALARHLLPWTLGALLLIVPSGLLMFSAHAADFVGNPVFVLKMTLLIAAFVNAAAFHVGMYRSVAQWERDRPTPLAAKLHAAASL